MITRLERLFFLYSNRGQRRREVRALLAAVVVGLFLAAIMVLVMIVRDGSGGGSLPNQ
jgi:hypothetical protein